MYMIAKPKKKIKLSTLRNKADRLLQQLVRETFRRCEVCGKEVSAGHHYFPKSMSTALRYDMENLIPICNGCHVRHHSGDPTIHQKVLKGRGQDWHDKLEAKRGFIKADANWYLSKIEALETALNN